MTSAENTVTIFVNGNEILVPPNISIAQLLEKLEINHPALAVELNGEIRTRNEFVCMILQSGDSLEIVSLVGGG